MMYVLLTNEKKKIVSEMLNPSQPLPNGNFSLVHLLVPQKGAKL